MKLAIQKVKIAKNGLFLYNNAYYSHILLLMFIYISILQKEVEDYYEAFVILSSMLNDSPLKVCPLL